MPMALDTVVGTVTAPGATITALTAASGDSFTVKYVNPGSDIWLVQALAFVNVQGVFRIRSPRLHDNVQGIRLQTVATQARPLLQRWPLQRLYAQDVLIAEMSGSGVAGNIETGLLMIYYADLQGIAARFISPDDLKRRGVNELTNEVDLAPGVGGGYTGGKALNATFDFLKANTDYALLGATVSATSGFVTVKGPDTGNLRVAIPSDQTLGDVIAEWFLYLSWRTGMNLIPIINSANKAATTVEGVASQAGTAVNASLNLVELAPAGSVPPVAAAPPVR